MIGSLRHRVTIQHRPLYRERGVYSGRFFDYTNGQDVNFLNGQDFRFIDEWNDLETVYARVEPLRGVEASTAGQKEATIQHRITMRYRPNVGAFFNFIDGDFFQFLDGQRFEFVETRGEILGRYRIRYKDKFFDIRDVQQMHPHDEFTVVRAEEVVT